MFKKVVIGIIKELFLVGIIVATILAIDGVFKGYGVYISIVIFQLAYISEGYYMILKQSSYSTSMRKQKLILVGCLISLFQAIKENSTFFIRDYALCSFSYIVLIGITLYFKIKNRGKR